MENVLGVDGVFTIINGTEPKAANPLKEPEEKDAESEYRYTRLHQDYLDHLNKWNEKNIRACSRMKLAYKDNTLVEMKNMNSAKKMWEKLAKFNQSDKSILRTALRQLSRASLSDHKSVQEYGDFIKKQAQDCTNTGKTIEDWMLRNFFSQGLSPELEAYIIPREQLTEENDKDLDLNDMIKSIVEYGTRVKDQEVEKKVVVQRVKNASRDDKGKRNRSKQDKNKDKKNRKNQQNKKKMQDLRCQES